MKLKTERDLRGYIARSVKTQLSEAKRTLRTKGQLNESIIGGLASMGAIGGVMGLSSWNCSSSSLSEGDGNANDPDLVAATQFSSVIADYIEAHADEIAADFVMKHDDDGMYPSRIEDIDNMAKSVAKKVMMQLNVEELIANVVAQTYRTALGG